MSWRDEKVEKLQRSRDFSFLDDDDRQNYVQRSRQPKASDDRVSDKMNQEARDRLLRLKALEKQRAEKQKKQYVEESSSDERDRRDQRKESEKNPGISGNKRVSAYDNFGSFFGKVERVVSKRILDEQRAREIAAREARQAAVERPKPKGDGRKVSESKQSSKPTSGAVSSRPAPKPQNPVSIKAQKLKDNRDYSFLFSDEPSKPPTAEARDSRPQSNKALKESRESLEVRQKTSVSQSQKPKQASNGVLRPSSGHGSTITSRKPAVSRPSSAGERDKYAKNSAGDRYGKDSAAERIKYANDSAGGRDKYGKDSRHDGERSEKDKSLPSSRVVKNAIQERPLSGGPTSKIPISTDRDKRADQEKSRSLGHPKPTNHDRPVSRDSLSMKSSSQARVSQAPSQRISHPSSVPRERVLQKSATETRVSQSVYRGSQSEVSAMKRKMVGEPSRKATITAKANDGRRVDRSRCQDSDSESEERNAMRKLVSGGPRPSQAAPSRISQPNGGLKRKISDKPVRSRPAPPKESKRQIYPDSDMDSESGGDGVGTAGISSIIQKLFGYDRNKYKDFDDEDDKNMETSFRHIQAEERRSAKLAREEDEREQELIEQEEREERLRKIRKQKMMK